ncbi:Na+/H+ antiporter [bacterium SCN 62-11]|nr:Na+/H+ antiporter [Candidatus Eremiobacteraeota bacterium]ODT75779.1 MAG: Na+/H+ antiporter [bacterium SCN 62-11]
MTIALSVLCMLLAVALSDVIVRVAPFRAPLPLVQILLGWGLAELHWAERLPLSPQLFFLIFLAPLLAADGVRMPRREMAEMRAPIMSLAVGLVFVTVLGIGHFVHRLIPGMPLAVACALGAVLAPTDAVAVSGLAGNLGIPRRLMHLLRGEALLNDATAVVSLRLAVGAALTGHFSLGEGLLRFLQLSLVGALVGTLVGALSGRFCSWLARRHYEDPSGQALLSLALPFTSYLLAEHCHGSGILAAVATGLAFNVSGLVNERESFLRLHIHGVWRMLEFTLNGLIFVLLGLELPEHLGSVPPALQSGFAFVLYPLLVLGALALIRLFWAYVWMRKTFYRRKGKLPLKAWRLIGTAALAGVRGTVSLASVLSLPVASSSGALFPYRDAAIYLATSVTLATLLLAAVGLPLILKDLKLPPLDEIDREEARARAAMLERAREVLPEAVEGLIGQGYPAEAVQTVGTKMMEVFQLRVEEQRDRGDSGTSLLSEVAGRLRGAVAQAQQRVLLELFRQKKINNSTLAQLQEELDIQQAAAAPGRRGE